MKIIVCGAGSVGRSIVSYLVKGNNDIVVIDDNQRYLDEISKEFDVLPVLGMPSHPDILERADASRADLLLAVTDTDEVNMVICQIAHSLFNVPHKIARIDSEDFLDPLWATLYNENHLPIDQIISPNIAIAEAVLRILKFPGSSGILPVLGGKAYVLTLKLDAGCPLVRIPLMHLTRSAPDLDVAFINVLRDGNCEIPEMYDSLEVGDEINILVKADNVDETIREFGLERPTNERLVIFGGNSIANYLGQKIEHDDSIVSCKIIEENIDEARRLAKDLSHVIVIQGPMMSDLILDEAGISHADASVAVTSNDKDNLLASLLATKSGVHSTISVLNTPSYNNLVVNIGNNILVDRSSVTISQLLKEIRKTKMIDAYSVSRGCGEIWEIRIEDENLCTGKKIGELNLPKMSRIFAVLHNGELVYPDPTTDICSGDIMLLYVDSGAIKQVEKIFS